MAAAPVPAPVVVENPRGQGFGTNSSSSPLLEKEGK